MTRPEQLTLALNTRRALARKDFLVSDCNRAAFEAVARDAGPIRRLALSGPGGAGKTHLAAIWAEATGAVFLPAVELSDASLEELTDHPAMVIEDADRAVATHAPMRRRLETLLFHAMNLTAAEGIGLMVTGRMPPARWRVEIPDLASRLAAMHHVAIHAPDDTLLSSILVKLFNDRQLKVGPDVIKYLSRRMERTFAAAERVVERLDHAALAGQRPITRRLASELFGSGEDALLGDGEE